MMSIDLTAALLDTADSDFGRDVLLGLSQPQKQVPCTWLYDHRGSELFEDITVLPEYYPTRAEVRILQRARRHLAHAAGPGAVLAQRAGWSPLALWMDDTSRFAVHLFERSF